MSLVVWLPLNGNLNNQGLDGSLTVTNHGATVDNAGKIGQCYSFDGVDDYIAIGSTRLYSVFSGSPQSFSVAFWLFSNDAGSRSIWFGDYATAGGSNFNIEKYYSNSERVRLYWGSPDFVFSSAIKVPDQKWVHFVLSYDGNNKCRIYFDGVLQDTYTISLPTKTKTSGYYFIGRDGRTGDTAFKGKINDFRIYDHCLSAKEIKELSKGLCLHYTLSDPYLEPTTNLLLQNNINAVGNSTKGWYSNQNTTLSVFSGENSYIKCLSNQSTSTPGLYCTLTGLTANTTYTVSVNIKTNVKTALYFWDYVKGTGKIVQTDYLERDKEERISLSCNIGDLTAIRIYFFMISPTTSSYILIRNIQLEKNDHATPFSPDTRRENGVVADSSGFGYNGTITSGIVSKENSARYSNCLYWGLSPIRISSPVIYNGGNCMTINLWFKCSNTSGGGGYHIPFSNSRGTGVEMSVNSAGKFRGGVVVDGTRYVANCTNPSILDGKWHMLSISYDGNVIRRYVDAAEYVSTNVSGIGDFANGYYCIGTMGPYNNYYNKNVHESDVRIYATALSESDIKELYQTSASIDKNGNLHCYQLKEIE